MPVKKSRQILSLKRRKSREAERKFLIEGIRLCEEALRSGAAVEQLIFSREDLEKSDRLQRLFQDAGRAQVFVQQTDRRAMKSMSETPTPQGVLGVVGMPDWDRERALCSVAPLLLLDRMRDPGNLGLILRTAEAAGSGAVFLSSGSVELYNPKVVRASMGAIFRLPVFCDEDLAGLLETLQARDIPTVSAHLDGDPYYETTLAPPFALLLGNEAFGVDPDLAARADRTLAIPMAAPVESLNVAIAAGILLYHLHRPLRQGCGGA